MNFFVCKTKLEKLWLVTAVVVFVAHRLLDGSASGYAADVTPLRVWLELAMVVLSFPLGGLTLFALHGLAFWCDDCRQLEFLFDWSTLLFAGYIQWFWVLPQFLRGSEMNLLDLKRPAEAPAPQVAPQAAPHLAPADTKPARASFASAPPPTLKAAPPAAFDAAAFVPRLAEFDEAGRSALDRVFHPPAPASPSHVEAIFPHVS